jgi:hypothetical protein
VHHQGISVGTIEVDDGGKDIEPGVTLANNRVADAAVDGIRYYDTSLYVLVYPDGQGGIRWRIYELPDQTKLRAIQPYNMIAQLDSTFVFSHGTLVSTTEQVDTTAVPRAAIAALAKVLPSVLAFAQTQPGTEQARAEYEVPPIHLYKVVVKDGVFELNGGPSDQTILVTLNPERKPTVDENKPKVEDNKPTTAPATQSAGSR